MKTNTGSEPNRTSVALTLSGAMLMVAMPTWSASPVEEATFFAADVTEGDQFGYSVALSGDTALIGVRFDDDDANGLESGSAYVFTRSGTTWSQQARLTADDGSDRDWFGVRVALSGDTVLIGARFDDDDANGTDSGSAYVFTRSGTTWSQKTELTAANGKPGDQFGGKVAIAGGTAVVGARLVDDVVKGVDTGAAYIFTGLPEAGNDAGQRARESLSQSDEAL